MIELTDKEKEVAILTLADNWAKGNLYTAVPIKVGLKITVKEDILKNLNNEPYIQENFKLNIRRLNRWWYSIYFDEKVCTES